MQLRPLLVAVAFVAVPLASFAQHDDTEHQSTPENAWVDFGVLATAPIGSLPCLQEGAIGGPGDPCSYKLHYLDPEEVTILKGGEVTFQVHGGGHAMAIYQVSKNTTRDRIGQFLCFGDDPNTIAEPGDHVCNLSAANANAQHVVGDGRGNVVIVAQLNPTVPPAPEEWPRPRTRH